MRLSLKIPFIHFLNASHVQIYEKQNRYLSFEQSHQNWFDALRNNLQSYVINIKNRICT